MMGGQQPVFVLQEGTEREQGKGAQSKNIQAARAIADAVRTTLGPKGMDKMLVDSMGDVVITNDGVTILKDLDIDHPAAEMVVEVAKTQDQEAGDGTTTSVVLAGELLKQAEDLVEDVHPTLICQGYRLASLRALDILDEFSIEVTPDDTDVLESIAATAMTGKSAEGDSELLSEIAVAAVQSVADENADGTWTVDQDNIQFVAQQGGSVGDSELIDGVLINKDRVHTGMPTSVTDGKVAIVNGAFEVEETELDAQVQISDPDQLEQFLEQEEDQLRELVDKVDEAGADVVFCGEGIDDVAQHFLAKKGIYAVRRVSDDDVAKLERATGATAVNSAKDLTSEDLGTISSVEQRKVGDDDFTFVEGTEDVRAVTILLRGGTEHVIDEIERSIEDAVRVSGIALEDGQVVPGGGAPEVELALRLREYANKVGGREQLAVEAFAESLEIVPRTLAENGGLDAIQALVDLRSAHESGQKAYGFDVVKGEVADSREANVLEPMRVKTQAVQSATEVAEMILRIDDVIAAKGSDGGDGGGPDIPGL
jgi:thermosome